MVEIVENTENENELEYNDANKTESVLNSSDTVNIIKMYITFLLMFQTVFHYSMNVLFAFFCTLLAVLGKALCCEVLVQFASKLPKNVRLARIVAGGRQQFREFCCCVKCHSIYPKEECILKDRFAW